MKICRTLMLLIVFLVPAMPGKAEAHEIQPAVADIAIGEESIQLEIRFNGEVLLAGIDASQIEDTGLAPEAAAYDRLRGLDDEVLGNEIRAAAAALLPVFDVANNGIPLTLRLDKVMVEPEPDLSLPRLTRVQLSAKLPTGQAEITFRADPAFGPVVLRQVAGIGETESTEAGDEMLYTVYLLPGDVTAPIVSADQARNISAVTVFGEYIRIGIVHIIPKGVDHIAFIMGLFFFSPRWRPLIGQVTIFTVAHSITLALASLGVVKVPAAVVEPLIALSIAWIGVENIIRPRLGMLRLGVIFGFGLLHGLGFAFVLAETGFSGASLALNMLAFNIGVELGQILVLAPLILVAFRAARLPWYQPRLASPASALIAALGLFWFVERITAG
ncbi:HupE/UreJ family protein [Alphaproteobacteria bacterium LSUCC0684]